MMRRDNYAVKHRSQERQADGASRELEGVNLGDVRSRAAHSVLLIPDDAGDIEENRKFFLDS